MTQKGKRRVKSNLEFPSVYQASEASVPLKGRRRKKKEEEKAGKKKDKFNID